jgi:hypothetical protein
MTVMVTAYQTDLTVDRTIHTAVKNIATKAFAKLLYTLFVNP